jgi:16S rRNA (uracil1498-N3)-methyltransferase
MSERFHVDADLSAGPFEITGPEAHHLATVCRLRPGDLLVLFNGRGEEYPARIGQVGKKSVVVEVLTVERPEREVGYRLEAAVPLPKGDRADFLIEKLTELGVTCFTPLQTARSVVHPRESKLDRLQRHVIEASKQCGRNVLMRIGELSRWSEFCRRQDLPGRKVLAHLGRQALSQVLPQGAGRDVVLAVGPEGGWSDEEVKLGQDAGWQVVSLGPRTLRVETAAVVLADRVAAAC